jgi:hypothetical protein
MIGIAGVARSGKDTLAKNLAQVIEEDLGVRVKILSFALPLRCQINELLEQFYHISAFTENEEEKKIIRPLLVAHGEQMKKRFGDKIWLDSLLGEVEELSEEKVFPIISDVRFDFEAGGLKESGGLIVHISKVGNQPANEIEVLNDPLVSKVADLNHTWPSYEPDQMDKCMDHAQILWQMLKEIKKEEWKKIYT